MNKSVTNTFKSQYVEKEVIGRGNFGSASLVINLQDKRFYVSKKILLEGLNEKDREGAKREANLLKELRHPNIVEYRDSFTEDGFLIIVMEYCDQKDLAHQIKKKRMKNEYFGEKTILNWFLQIALALEYIHSKKILHRDIKTSNIFVTGNGAIKLGDFGISKILEKTSDAANTVCGTPFYMSPEICENKPYTYKSDVWALGCVLYELCTLKHAFAADSLLGLVYKIVRDKLEPIPDRYSKDLQNLVQKILHKDANVRPSIKEIMTFSCVRDAMEAFVARDGELEDEIDNQPAKRTNESPGAKGRSKELRRDGSFEELDQPTPLGETGMSNTFTESSGVHEDTMKTLQTMNASTMVRAHHTGGNNNNNNYVNRGGLSKLNTNAAEEDDEYPDDFEEDSEDDDSSKPAIKQTSASQDKEHLATVVNMYKQRLAGGPPPVTGKSNLLKDEFEEIKEEPPRLESTGSGIMNEKVDMKLRIQNLRKKCIDELGESTFNKVYGYIKFHRDNETPDPTMRRNLVGLVGKKSLPSCNSVDELIFLENNVKQGISRWSRNSFDVKYKEQKSFKKNKMTPSGMNNKICAEKEMMSRLKSVL